jgi:hypothetical protein
VTKPWRFADSRAGTAIVKQPYAAQEFQKTGLVNPAVRTRRKADQQAAGPKRFRPLRTVIGWPFTTPF